MIAATAFANRTVAVFGLARTGLGAVRALVGRRRDGDCLGRFQHGARPGRPAGRGDHALAGMALGEDCRACPVAGRAAHASQAA